MKKALLMAALAAVLALAGCKKENVAPYGWFLEVKNYTDKEIVIGSNTADGYLWFDGDYDNYGAHYYSYGGYGSSENPDYPGHYGYGPDSFIIAPGKTGTIYGVYAYASADSGTIQPDRFRPDDVLPFGDPTTAALPDGGAWLSMTLGGGDVTGRIWARKHWSFRGTEHDRIYTLTVTDALLEELAAPAVE